MLQNVTKTSMATLSQNPLKLPSTPNGGYIKMNKIQETCINIVAIAATMFFVTVMIKMASLLIGFGE